MLLSLFAIGSRLHGAPEEAGEEGLEMPRQAEEDVSPAGGSPSATV